MSDQRPAVSARGVLDGDPVALAGLCDLRGPSVVAYCEAVCGPDVSVDAAAAAFAAFRATAVHATAPLALNPDALLLAKAREAAAARAPDPAPGAARPDDPLCPDVPRLLAGDASQSLTVAERHHLRRHLARCVPCRHAQNAQRAAERAYVQPPVRALTPIARQAIIAALRHAAPVVDAAANGGVRRAVAAPTPARPLQAPSPPAVSADPPAPRPDPTAPVRPLQAPPPIATGPPAPRPAPTETGPLPHAGAPDAIPIPPPLPRPARPVPESPVYEPPRAPDPQSTGVIPIEHIAAALGYAADEAWQPPVAAGASGRRPSPIAALRGRLPGARVLGPAVFLLVALLIVLAIAGVFSSGRSPSASPGTVAPTATTPSTTVAKSSTAAHRARLRAAARRRAARARAKAAAGAVKTGSATTTTPTPTPATTTTAAPTTGTAQNTATPAATHPTATALGAPAARVPPRNGAGAAPTGGFRSD